MATKQRRMQHYLEEGDLDGSWCFWNHDGERSLQLVNGSTVAPPSGAYLASW
jgi:hypothetical protein